MSAGLMGAARRRRVSWVEWEGEIECVWRLVGVVVSLACSFLGGWCERLGGGAYILEDIFGLAIFGVDEGFSLRVAVGGDVASAV